jgi:diadenosine tetraphosphate (Ap4A) HIT family hydrolase
MKTDPLVVMENEYFIAGQCRNCDLPGYIILESKVGTERLHGLSARVQPALGATIAALEKAIIATLKPKNVYCAKFGEELSRVHFHLFPRTEAVPRRFLDEHPEGKNRINGPILLYRAP